MNSDDPVHVAEAWLKALATKDVESALALMSEGFFRVADDTRWRPVARTHWAESMSNLFAAFPDWSRQLRHQVVSDDWVICQLFEQGTFTKPYRTTGGVTKSATGERFTDWNCEWLRIEDGLLVELRSYTSYNQHRMFGLQALDQSLVENVYLRDEGSRLVGDRVRS